jgi:hypothetical protein
VTKGGARVVCETLYVIGVAILPPRKRSKQAHPPATGAQGDRDAENSRARRWPDFPAERRVARDDGRRRARARLAGALGDAVVGGGESVDVIVGGSLTPVKAASSDAKGVQHAGALLASARVVSSWWSAPPRARQEHFAAVPHARHGLRADPFLPEPGDVPLRGPYTCAVMGAPGYAAATALRRSPKSGAGTCRRTTSST